MSGNPVSFIEQAGEAGSAEARHLLFSGGEAGSAEARKLVGIPSASQIAQDAANAFKKALGSGWDLVFGNTTGLLGRILKVGFGSILIIIGVSKLTGANNKVMDLAKNVKVIPV